MSNLIELAAAFLNVRVTVRLLRRYLHAMREIEKVRSANSRFGDEHVCNARVLRDRLALLEHLPEGGVAAEVGVATGDYSSKILEIAKPEKLHLVDLWADNGTSAAVAGSAWDIVNRRFASEIEKTQVVLHRGLSWEMLALLPDHSLDWVYIDAAHDFESVKRDLEMAQRYDRMG